MTKPAKSSSKTDSASAQFNSLSNPAVARCYNAWRRAGKLASIPINGKAANEFDVKEQSEAAFRNAMPPLSGEDNIRDFIACVAYAMLKELMFCGDCKDLLGAAKVALSAARINRRQPKA